MTALPVAGAARQRGAMLAGATTAAPYVLAFAPYGLAIGAFADQARVSDLLGWSTAWLNYAGTSQLVLLQLLDAGAAPVAVVATVALINLRLVAYATALSPQWRTAPRWWVALASYLLVDPAYVIAAQRREGSGPAGSGSAGSGSGSAGTGSGSAGSGVTGEPDDVRWHRGFYLGAAATLWASWLLVCAAGVILGSRLGSLVPAGALADLMLVAMVAVLARDRGARVAAAVGFGLGVPAVLLPGGTGALVAAVVAVAIAAGTGRRSR